MTFNFDKLGRSQYVKNFSWQFTPRNFPYHAADNMLDGKIRRHKRATQADSFRRAIQRDVLENVNVQKASCVMAVDSLRLHERRSHGVVPNADALLRRHKHAQTLKERTRQEPSVGENCHFLPAGPEPARAVGSGVVVGVCFTLDKQFHSKPHRKTFFVWSRRANRREDVLVAVRIGNIWKNSVARCE